MHRNTWDGFSVMEEDRPAQGQLLLNMETQALRHVGTVAQCAFTKRNKTTEYTSFIVSSVNKNEQPIVSAVGHEIQFLKRFPIASLLLVTRPDYFWGIKVLLKNNTF